jgi:hypothetical protein
MLTNRPKNNKVQQQPGYDSKSFQNMIKYIVKHKDENIKYIIELNNTEDNTIITINLGNLFIDKDIQEIRYDRNIDPTKINHFTDDEHTINIHKNNFIFKNGEKFFQLLFDDDSFVSLTEYDIVLKNNKYEYDYKNHYYSNFYNTLFDKVQPQLFNKIYPDPQISPKPKSILSTVRKAAENVSCSIRNLPNTIRNIRDSRKSLKFSSIRPDTGTGGKKRRQTKKARRRHQTRRR